MRVFFVNTANFAEILPVHNVAAALNHQIFDLFERKKFLSVVVFQFLDPITKPHESFITLRVFQKQPALKLTQKHIEKAHSN